VEREPQLRVLAEGAEQPLELGDPVAQGVVVEVQLPCRLRDVQVRVEQHLEGLPQVGAVLLFRRGSA
jgi:hypothetical protein